MTTTRTASMAAATTRPVTRLLVPLHSTMAASPVVPIARALAARLDVSVAVVDCVPAPAAAVDERQWVLEEAAAAQLDLGGPDVIHVTHDVVGDILATAAAVPGTVVCMAAHGRAAVAELVLGSVTHDVIVASPTPVLVVGPQAVAPGSFQAIQVCFDGSPTSERTIDVAMAWARQLRASPWITQVVEPSVPDSELVVTADVSESAALRRLGGRLRSLGVDVEWDVLHGRHPADSLADWATVHGPALLVVGSHGRSGFDRKGLGSVTGRLIHTATCPLLVVGPVALVPS